MKTLKPSLVLARMAATVSSGKLSAESITMIWLLPWRDGARAGSEQVITRTPEKYGEEEERLSG